MNQIKLRQHYHTLRAQQRVFEGYKHTNIDDRTVGQLMDAIQRLEADFPDLVPAFNENRFFSHQDERRNYYDVTSILGYLAAVIGTLEAQIEAHDGEPVVTRREFAFLKDDKFRKIVERDYIEIQRTFVAQCWKSVIILCGGIIEGMLTDLLLAERARAVAATSAPTKTNDITRWDLSDLIKVAVEIKLVTPAVEKLSSPIREYRNLVHPGNELRSGLVFGQEEAKIAIEVLNIIYRDLS